MTCYLLLLTIIITSYLLLPSLLATRAGVGPKVLFVKFGWGATFKNQRMDVKCRKCKWLSSLAKAYYRDAIFPDLPGIPDFHKSKFSMKDL